MTIDELIKYAKYEVTRREKVMSVNCTDEIDDEFLNDGKLIEIALAALKADKQGLRMCEYGEYLEDDYTGRCEMGFTPVETELDKILKELE